MLVCERVGKSMSWCSRMVQRELRNAERNRGLLAGRIMQHLHASLALVQLSTGTANSGRDSPHTQQGGQGGMALNRGFLVRTGNFPLFFF